MIKAGPIKVTKPSVSVTAILVTAPRKPGRPPNPNKLSNAAKQKAYRERKKAAHA